MAGKRVSGKRDSVIFFLGKIFLVYLFASSAGNLWSAGNSFEINLAFFRRKVVGVLGENITIYMCEKRYFYDQNTRRKMERYCIM